ncbi:MAG: hypothetical protein J6B23_07080 [Clostridia bacterium]|nr:hypothetical protein [Clostridia bacterium]
MKKHLRRISSLMLAILVAVSAMGISVFADGTQLVTLSFSGALRQGKVLTVTPTIGTAGAQLCFDDVVIAENATDATPVRYLIPHDAIPGSHAVKLVADGEVVASENVTVYAKGEAAGNVTIDFEDYEGTIAADETGCVTGATDIPALESSIGWLRGLNQGNKVGVREIDGNKKVSIYTTVDGYYHTAYIHANALENADKTYTNVKDGKLYIEFDVDFFSNWRRGIMVDPYDSSNTQIAHVEAMVSQGGINSVEGTKPSANGECKCHVSMIFDLDNRVAGGSVTMTDVNGKTVTETLKETALPEEIKNVSFYRIGVGSHKNQWINFDNIKTGYVESGFLGGTSYTKDGASVKADDVISCEADSIEIAVNKEIASIDSMVALKVNGEEKTVNATYANGVISVPVSELGLRYGNKVELTVSENTPLADETTADEQIYLELTVGNEEGILFDADSLVEVLYEGYPRPGKVITIKPSVPSQATSAELRFDGEVIAANVTSDTLVRYLIPHEIQTGVHSVDLVVNPSMSSEMVISKELKVYSWDETADYVTIDFEDYTGTIAEDETGYVTGDANMTTLLNNIGWLRAINTGNNAAIREIDGNKVLSIYSTKAVYYHGAYFMANAVENADKTYTNVTSGKTFIEFDVEFTNSWRRGIMVNPFDSSNNQVALVEAMVSQKGINSPEGTVPANGIVKCHVSMVFDIDNRVAGGTVTMTDSTGKTVTETLNETALPETIKNISYYRIGVGTGENKIINFDNIKTGYAESSLLKSASYTQGGKAYKTDSMISSKADSIELAVSKDLASVDSMVGLKVNGVAKTVNASYENGVISVPLIGVAIAKGDTVELTVSENTLTTAETTVDEQIKLTLTAGDENGNLITVADGKAVATLNVVSASAVNAKAYIAVYNGTKLVSVTPANVKTMAGNSYYTSDAVTLPETYTTVKAMVWNGTAPLIPTAQYNK